MTRLSKLLVAGAGVAEARPNPIRRIVTLLQNMSEEIETEVEKEKKQMQKFDCFCKKNDGVLDKKAKEAAAMIAKVKAEVDSLVGQEAQLREEIKKHKAERASAQEQLQAAAEERKNEKTKYEADTKESQTAIDQMQRAIKALTEGSQSFLQTNTAASLKKVITTNSDAVQQLDLNDQETLMSFLQSGKDFAPQSGEIIGILKTMLENFDKSLGGVISQETAAKKAYATLKKSLEDLIATSSTSIENKGEAKGKVAVEAVQKKNLVNVTEKQMGDDMATLAELKESCKNKGSEFTERQADAAAEVDAIGQAIAVLNDDDALRTFDKAVKSDDEAALIQMRSSRNSPVVVANQLLSNESLARNPAVAMLAFSAKQALKSKKADFSKIFTMIDDMVGILKAEQKDDEEKRDQCEASLTENDDELKTLGRALESLAANIEKEESEVEVQDKIVAKNQADIAECQKAMAEATEQRKEENAEFVATMSVNAAAVDLIQKAKDKLNTYYNPQLVTTEAPAAVSAEDQIVGGAFGGNPAAGTQQPETAPAFIQQPEAPETFSGARDNKSAKGTSVLALMDMLANDINKDTSAMEHAEQTAQRDYEQLSKDLVQQTEESKKAAAEAAANSARASESKLSLEDTQSMKESDQALTQKSIHDLHQRCDFLMKNFEERREARTNEEEGLSKAKAVLAGAKFGF